MTQQLPQPSPDEAERIAEFKSWLRENIQQPVAFSEYMQLILNHPFYGYYRQLRSPLSKTTASGDFTTASELTDLYALTIAGSLAAVLQQCARPKILELGAGSGAFAAACLLQLNELKALPKEYLILETSSTRIGEQKEKLQPIAERLNVKITWLDKLPEDCFNGVIVANEILDVLPVEVFRITDRGYEMLNVACAPDLHEIWQQPTADLQNALDHLQQKLYHKLAPDMQSEICLCLSSWLSSIAKLLQQGMLFFVDYGYTREVYYHPERTSGTLHCHYRQHMHTDPFLYPGLQDVTAHVDFSAVGDVLAGLDFECLGLQTQAEYLASAGILQHLQAIDTGNYHYEAERVKKLLHPAQMGEVFKVMAFVKNIAADVEIPGFL